MARLFTAIEQLEHCPESGRVVREFADPMMRELVRGSYRIVYRVQEATVQMLRVHHAARPLPPDLTSNAG